MHLSEAIAARNHQRPACRDTFHTSWMSASALTHSCLHRVFQLALRVSKAHDLFQHLVIILHQHVRIGISQTTRIPPGDHPSFHPNLKPVQSHCLPLFLEIKTAHACAQGHHSYSQAGLRMDAMGLGFSHDPHHRTIA